MRTASVAGGARLARRIGMLVLGLATLLVGARADAQQRRTGAPPIGPDSIVSGAITEDTLTFGDAPLRGVLVRPDVRTGVPAVVIVHGSGPDDGMSYLHYARAFARRGIAALVYDKRGFGASGGDWRRRTLDQLTDDALAGVTRLRTVPGILADGVGMWGISQGGWIVAHAAARDSTLAFAVVVSGGVVSPTQQEMYHKDQIFRELGYSPRARELGVRFWRLLFDGLVLYTHGAVPLPDGVLEGELAAARFGLDHEPAGDWRRIGRRGRPSVLAAFGERDLLGPVEESVLRLHTTLDLQADTTQPASPGSNQLRVYRGASHTITTRTTGLRFDWDSAFVPTYLGTVTIWMHAAATAHAPPQPLAAGTAPYVGRDFVEGGRYGPLPWYGRFYPQLFAVCLFAVTFTLVLLGGGWRSLRRRVLPRAVSHDAGTRPDWIASAALMVTAALDLALLIGFGWLVLVSVYVPGMGGAAERPLDGPLRLLPLLGVSALVSTVVMIGAMWRARRTGAWAGRVPVLHVLAAVVAVVFVPWLVYWQFLGAGL